VQIEPKAATTKGSADWFRGDVWVDPIAVPKDGDQRMLVSRVRFTPGARTAWHAHGRGQTLHIIEGVALIGTRDGTVIRATPGQTVYTPPRQEQARRHFGQFHGTSRHAGDRRRRPDARRVDGARHRRGLPGSSGVRATRAV